MNRIIPIGLMIVLATTGCTGPGGLFGDDEENEELFVYDLTIEDPVSYTHLTLPTNREV